MLWEHIHEQALSNEVYLSKYKIHLASEDVVRYGYALIQENANEQAQEAVRHALAALAVVSSTTERGALLRDADRPLTALKPLAKPRFVILQNVDVGPFKRMVHMVLTDDSVTDALRLSRQDVNDARRDILGGFVDAKHGYTCQFVPLQKTTLRLLLDAVRYAIATSALHAPYARYKDEDFARFRDDIAYILSKRERPKHTDKEV